MKKYTIIIQWLIFYWYLIDYLISNNYEKCIIIGWLFDYLIDIWLIIWFMIDHLMIILSQLCWLFDDCCDYLTLEYFLFFDWSLIIIFSQIFVLILMISTPAAGKYASFIS